MVVFNPFVPSYKINPHLQYARLRAAEPVHRSIAMQAWILTRYEDCIAVLRDPDTFSSDGLNASGQLGDAIREQRATSALGQVQTLLTVDPPAHTRLRGVINRAFTPRRVELLRPRIEAIAQQLLDALPPSGGDFELMTAFAQPLPVIVIAELLGIPSSDRDRFKQWSNKIAATTDLLNAEDAIMEAREATLELIDYFNDFIQARRDEPRDDLISALVAAQSTEEQLTHEEILAFAILLLVAGNETTTNLIGNGTLALLDNPEAFESLRSQPNYLPAAIEEMLRYDSPVQGVVRIARRDTTLGTQQIAQGDLLMLMLGAANRDPQQFDDPDRFDASREANRHLSFGLGPHFCLGAPLARLEAEVAFTLLLQRFPNIARGATDMERGGTLLLRGLTKLPLTVS
ncbi:MAG: cytochrome P450 [Dehalococcoidia bacterium]|jgi:cytochrome P450|nr:cytochrome P450 [Dehalococcoidia bacterium]